jgi:hypothetical protein
VVPVIYTYLYSMAQRFKAWMARGREAEESEYRGGRSGDPEAIAK